MIPARTACCLLLLAGCASTSRFTPPEMKSYEVSLAADADRGLVLSWYASVEGQRDAIYLRRADAGGRPRGAAIRLSDGERDAYEPSLQMLDGDAVVAWYEKSTNGHLQAVLGRFAPSGTARWLQVLSPADQMGRIPVVRVHDARIHVAWLQQPAQRQPSTVHHALVEADGRWIRSPRQIGTAGADTWNLNAAVDAGGRFLLVFDARTVGSANELQLIEVTGNDTRHLTLSAEDGHASTYPDLVLNGDRVALTWFDNRDGNEEVYLFAGTLAELTGPLDSRATRVTRSDGASMGAYAAWNADRIGLTWCDDGGSGQRVYFQTFDARAQPLGAAIALTDGRLQGLIPSVVAWGQGFAVAWNERVVDPSAHRHGATISSFATLRTDLGRDSR